MHTIQYVLLRAMCPYQQHNNESLRTLLHPTHCNMPSIGAGMYVCKPGWSNGSL